MWTIEYHGYYIHGFCDRDECRVQSADHVVLATFTSLERAKAFVRGRMGQPRANRTPSLTQERYELAWHEKRSLR